MATARDARAFSDVDNYRAPGHVRYILTSIFSGNIRKAITLVVMRIFRRDKKHRMGNFEENTFIERMKVYSLKEIRYLFIIYVVTKSQFM